MPKLKELIDRLPEGYSEALFAGRRYGVTRRSFNAGRSLKVFAEELGGDDIISLNAYRLASGWRLNPCEMSSDKVLGFLEHQRPLRQT